MIAPYIEDGLGRISEPKRLFSAVGLYIGPQDTFLDEIEIVIETALFNDMHVFFDPDIFKTFDKRMSLGYVKIIFFRYFVFKIFHHANLRLLCDPIPSHL